MGCSICQDPLFRLESSNSAPTSSRLKPAALSCGHVFHGTCIDKWFASSSNNSCPLCHKRHCGPALVLYIEADEDEKSSRPSNNTQPQTAASSSSPPRETGQTLDVYRLCECFAELGMDIPGPSDYEGYSDYCDVMLDELVASTAQLVSKHEDDRGKLQARIDKLAGDLKHSNDLCRVHENEIARLTKLSEAHRRHITGLAKKRQADY
ncbi:hypothetical protein EV178_004313 [Coemansia sp. RSA 1646]|nr:hypothetical protein EV178_004313 [Coemansia sp. RSA 1646]